MRAGNADRVDAVDQRCGALMKAKRDRPYRWVLGKPEVLRFGKEFAGIGAAYHRADIDECVLVAGRDQTTSMTSVKL